METGSRAETQSEGATVTLLSTASVPFRTRAPTTPRGEESEASSPGQSHSPVPEEAELVEQDDPVETEAGFGDGATTVEATASQNTSTVIANPHHGATKTPAPALGYITSTSVRDNEHLTTTFSTPVFTITETPATTTMTASTTAGVHSDPDDVSGREEGSGHSSGTEAPPPESEVTLLPDQSETSAWWPRPSTAGPQESRSDPEYSGDDGPIVQERIPESSAEREASTAATAAATATTTPSSPPATDGSPRRETVAPERGVSQDRTPAVGTEQARREPPPTRPPTLASLPNERAAVGRGRSHSGNACATLTLLTNLLLLLNLTTH